MDPSELRRGFHKQSGSTALNNKQEQMKAHVMGSTSTTFTSAKYDHLVQKYPFPTTKTRMSSNVLSIVLVYISFARTRGLQQPRPGGVVVAIPTKPTLQQPYVYLYGNPKRTLLSTINPSKPMLYCGDPWVTRTSPQEKPRSGPVRAPSESAPVMDPILFDFKV